MKYPHIMGEIARTPWAITPDALRGIMAAIDEGIGSADYPAFHGSDPATTDAVAAQLGTRPEGSRLSFIRDGIGALQINGPIVPRADAFTESSGLTSIDRLTSEFRALEAHPDVTKILLVIDSPGGAITGVSEFAKTVAASTKPTAAYVYGMAASAAYWIASAADEIHAGDTGLTGSIGVVMTVYKGAEDEVEIVSSQSPNKRPDPDTKEGRQELQSTVDDLAAVFIAAVAENRSTTTKAVEDNFGRGGMVMPTDAIKAGMIDGKATFSEYLGLLVSGPPAEPSPDSEPEPVIVPTMKLDTPPKSGENRGDRANAPTSHPEDRKMKLAEFLTEHPEAASEVEAIRAEARAAGVEDTNKRNAFASTILTSATYPEQIKVIAAAVVTGTKTPEHLDTAVSVFDALKGQDTITDAQADSDAAPATPPQNTEALSTDGVLRTPADIDAAAAAMKAGR